MLTRSVLALVFSLALSAQQNTVNLEVHTTNFPKNYTFQIELKLNYKVTDVRKMLSEGRNIPIEKDFVINQNSDNTCKWEISFNEEGKAGIKGSPQSAIFNFPKPLARMGNAHSTIKLEGKVTLLRDGKAFGDPMPLGQNRPFQPDATYVLLLQNATTGGITTINQLFLLKEELKDALEGKLQRNQMPAGMIPR